MSINEPHGSKRIPQETINRAIVLRRDEHKLLREIAEETGISHAHLKTIFKREGISVPYRRKAGARPSAPKKTPKPRRPRVVKEKPAKKEYPDAQRQISPVLIMQIEDRMRRRKLAT